MDGLTEYRVNLHEERGDKHTIVFECWADDPDHAAEQALSAYPAGEVTHIAPKQGDSPEPALRWTAGEWKIDRAHIYYTDSEGDDWTIATMEPGRDGEADQRLMHAAPEMASALVRLLACPDLNLDELEPETVEAIEQAEEALAKGGAHV